MATYFHGGSEIQGDGLQTLILMNPSYVGYSDTTQQQQQHHHHHHHQPPPSNIVFLNSATAAGTALAPQNLPHAPPNPTQQFVGIPLQPATSPRDPQQHELSALHGYVPRVPYNMYGPIDPAAAREMARAQQGLSLSLSSQQKAISPTSRADDRRISGGSSTSTASGISNGVNGVVLSSKYLKAAQELLEEVVNVGKGIKNDSGKGNKIARESSMVSVAAAGESLSGGGGGGETSAKRSGELTTAERQEIQMKKAKLVNMLDEVEQRYKQYYNQMQVVISWFEQAAGIDSAKTYTALALETISKQFRCLKDAIKSQIRAASRSLGEEDSFGGVKTEGSRLKFVDHQLRQQRALQQLGMIQPNAWRPQRGLPERSVSVLRAWLFEHFLHPYPKDSDKIMLAKQTGLTRSQVSNWFINARVRLWKPMVEEMYMEEIKEQEPNNGTSEDKATKTTANNEEPSPKSNSQAEKNFKSTLDNNPNAHVTNTPSSFPVSSTSTSPSRANLRNQSNFAIMASSEMEGIAQGSPKRQKGSEILNNEQVFMKFGDERQGREGFSLMGTPANFIGGFGSYPVGEIGRFGAENFPGAYSSGSNCVSLTLGLPHCENLSMQATHHSFLPNQSIQLGRRVDIGETNDQFGSLTTTPTSSTVYDNIEMQNRKRLAAQLLPDFVA
ncbi:hypothetical protein NMG60_11001555 [Bertholletia excelsa]